MLKQYAKIEANGDVIRTAIDPANTHLAAVIAEDGFLPLEIEEGATDSSEVGELDEVEHCFRAESDRVVRYDAVVQNAPRKIRAKIEELKSQLAATDYRVVKNQELSLAGLELEYDPTALYIEREALRNEIRELDEILIS